MAAVGPVNNNKKVLSANPLIENDQRKAQNLYVYSRKSVRPVCRQRFGQAWDDSEPLPLVRCS